MTIPEAKTHGILKESNTEFIDMRKKPFDFKFKDKNKHEFIAIPDFYLPTQNKFVEVKGYRLNSVESQAIAFDRLAYHIYRLYKTPKEQLEHLSHTQLATRLWKHKGYRKAVLDSCWSNSIYKHQIISDTLKGLHDYEIWFVDYKISTRLKNTLKRNNVEFVERI